MWPVTFGPPLAQLQRGGVRCSYQRPADALCLLSSLIGGELAFCLGGKANANPLSLPRWSGLNLHTLWAYFRKCWNTAKRDPSEWPEPFLSYKMKRLIKTFWFIVKNKKKNKKKWQWWMCMRCSSIQRHNITLENEKHWLTPCALQLWKLQRAEPVRITSSCQSECTKTPWSFSHFSIKHYGDIIIWNLCFAILTRSITHPVHHFNN